MTDEISKPAGDDLVRLSRADLVATVDAYRAAMGSRRMMMPVVGFIGGLFIGAAMLSTAEILGWPEALAPFFFFGGWAIALGFAYVGIRRDKRVRREYQWNCTHCSAPMLPTSGGDLSRAETAIATGRCPACGEELFDRVAPCEQK